MKRHALVIILLVLGVTGCGPVKNLPAKPPVVIDPGGNTISPPAESVQPVKVGEGEPTVGSVSFSDENHGWIVLGGKLLLATTDGGTAWHEVTRAKQIFRIIDFASSEDGFAVSESKLLATSDGGLTWKAQETNGVKFLNQVDFVDKLNGLGQAINLDGRSGLATTHDGGQTFTAVPVPCEGEVTAIAFLNLNRAWFICGGQAVQQGMVAKRLYRTVDGAKTWELVSETSQDATEKVGGLPLGGSIVRMFFVDEMHGWIGGARYGGLWATDDGGSTWRDLHLPHGDVVAGIRFFDRNRGFVILSGSAGSFLLRTVDGGGTWQQAYPIAHPS